MTEAMLPIYAVSEANVREHWAKKAARVKSHRAMARLLCPVGVPLPVTVTLTRYGSRELDDDNLRPALKAVRDGIADCYGIADNDKRIRFEYAQAKCKRGQESIHVKITGS